MWGGTLCNRLRGAKGILRGAAAEAAERDVNALAVVGGTLKSAFPGDAAQNEVYLRTRNAPVDGIIVGSGCVATYRGAEYLHEFVNGFRDMAVCSIGARSPGVPSLVISNQHGQMTLIDHLIEQHGCRTIGYIRGPVASAEADERLAGYRTALQAHDIPFDPELVRVGNARCASR